MLPEGACQCPPILTCLWARHLNHLLFQRQPSRLLLCCEPFGIMSTWMLVKRGYARKYISPLTLLERILMFKRCFPLPLHGPLQRPHFMLWDTSVAFQKSTVVHGKLAPEATASVRKCFFDPHTHLESHQGSAKKVIKALLCSTLALQCTYSFLCLQAYPTVRLGAPH